MVGQSSNWLVVRSLEVSISTFLFQLVCGICACEQDTVNFFHLVRVSQYLQNSSKDNTFGHLM